MREVAGYTPARGDKDGIHELGIMGRRERGIVHKIMSYWKRGTLSAKAVERLIFGLFFSLFVDVLSSIGAISVGINGDSAGLTARLG